MASSEGLFVATLYCSLRQKGIEDSIANMLAKQYAEIVFEKNKMIEIHKITERALNVNDFNLQDFTAQISTFHPKKQTLV